MQVAKKNCATSMPSLGKEYTLACRQECTMLYDFQTVHYDLLFLLLVGLQLRCTKCAHSDGITDSVWQYHSAARARFAESLSTIPAVVPALEHGELHITIPTSIDIKRSTSKSRYLGHIGHPGTQVAPKFGPGKHVVPQCIDICIWEPRSSHLFAVCRRLQE